MDSDLDHTVPGPLTFAGFRKRWSQKRAADVAESEPHDVIAPVDDHGDTLSLFGYSDDWGADVGDNTLGSWEHVEPDSAFRDVGFLAETAEGSSNKREFDDEMFCSDSGPRVLDPSGVEPDWRAVAMQSELKRVKHDFDKLPWEMDGTAFRSSDRWQGTILSNLDKCFTPACLGACDVLDSSVVSARACSSANTVDVPVVPLQLKRARKEPLDEDIRRQALLKFRDVVLQDPLATQLGTSLVGQVNRGVLHDDVDQSFRDCFRAKASSTLQKRAASITRLAKYLRAAGQLNPLRLSEAQLYSALCEMRQAGCGATSAQHVIEALHFLDATAKLLVVNLSDVISARCRGVARDMFLTKNPLRQKQPLTVEQVKHLEHAMQSTSPVLQCILGQLLFCVHACCRWRDSQRLKSIYNESGHGETLVHADAMTSKTTLTIEAKTRFLPYVALGTGVVAEEWSQMWLWARDHEGLEITDFVLPSYSEKGACWLGVPMSASEATVWLREFLEKSFAYQPELLGSHSCKSTLLTWIGRCSKIVFTPAERRLMGHHLDPSMKSVMCYSRESYTTLYAKVLAMVRLIRAGEFDPDLPAIARVVQMADESEETPLQDHLGGGADAEASDSESSMASLESLHDDRVVDVGVDDRCISLFPAFPGVPESGLLVHSISSLVHVVNEDDFLLCGRPTSSHFRAYAKVVNRDHLASCSQCLRAFQNRKV
eukprot:s704_g29.t1